MTLLHHVEGTLRPLIYPDEPTAFQFWVGAPIRASVA